MSTPNSPGRTLSSTSTNSSLTADSQPSSSSSSGGHESETVRMKTVTGPKKPIPLMEQDGYLYPKSSRNSDRPDESDEITALPSSWEKKFDDEVRHYDALTAKAREKREASVMSQTAILPKGNPASIAGEKRAEPPSEPRSEPRLQRTERSASILEAFRGGAPRRTRTSFNTDSMQSLTLGDLAKSRWVARHTVKIDEEGFPILDKIPAKFRRALADEYRDFSRKVSNQGLASEEREEHLKQALAKKFLALALLGPDSGFDKSKIGSRTAINQYLSKTFGVQIDPEPMSARDDAPGSPRSPSSPRSPGSPRSQRFSWFSSSSAWSAASDDFRDLLVQDAVHRSSNYRVDWSVDLSDIDVDPFTRKTFDDTIEKIRAHEVVSRAPNARTDVTATFQRDFPHSKYAYQCDDGSIADLKSIDEFIAFIGDPVASGLPGKVSHFACQNLGMFIKNLLFTRTDADGNPKSVLHLFDGTPIVFSTSPSARYLLKKAADGTVTLSYRSEIDTKDARKSGKNTASLLFANNGQLGSRGVLIENAHAVITLDVTFRPDGSARMGTLKLEAEGWNQVSE